MKKIFMTLVLMLALTSQMFSQTIIDTTKSITLDEVSIVSMYQPTNVEASNELTQQQLISTNIGQEPSFVFKKFPSIIAFSDNGTQFGYGYFRIRGLDQTRINATLDGMPWNEAEDFGIYFANSPDLMSSMHSIKIERGAMSSVNGIAGYAGGISLESVNLLKDTISYASFGYGSSKSCKASIVYNSGLFGKNKNNAIHVKASNSTTDGYKDNSWNKSQAVTIKYGHWFNDKHSIEFLTLNGHHRNNQGWIGCTEKELTENPKANGNTSEETDNWIQSVNKLTYKGWFTDNLMFTTSAYLQFQTGEYRFDLDNYMNRICGNITVKWPSYYLVQDSTGVYNPETEIFEPYGAIYDYGLTHYLYGNMSAMQWYVTDNFKLNAGYNVYRYQRRHYMNNTLDIVNVKSDEYYDNTGYKNDFSGFVSGTYEVSKFTFNGNIQYRYVDFDYKEKLHPYDYAFKKDTTYTYNTKWNFVNGGASVEYATTKNSRVYARYELTHREPTRTDMFDGNEYMPTNNVIGKISRNDTIQRIDTIPNSEYGNPYITTTTPEIVNDFEIGYCIDNNIIKANINVFFMKFKNERVLNGEFGMNGLPAHSTVKNSYRTGIEISSDINITKNILWSFNGSWSRNKIKTDDNNYKNHILTPTWVINNELVWHNDKIKIGVSEYWRSNMYIDFDNMQKVPDYFSLNVFGSYRIGKVEVGARINNITNRVNYQYGTVNEIDIPLYFQEAKISAFGDIKIYF